MGKVALQSPTHGQELPLISHSLLDKQVVGPKALSHAANALPHLRYELLLLCWIEHSAQQQTCMSKTFLLSCAYESALPFVDQCLAAKFTLESQTVMRQTLR